MLVKLVCVRCVGLWSLRQCISGMSFYSALAARACMPRGVPSVHAGTLHAEHGYDVVLTAL